MEGGLCDMLVQEKVKQACEILREFNVDCWLTFVRESQINGDPTLDFLLGADITWHSAFIVTSSGGTYAIVGQYDRKTVEDTGAYQHILDYVKSGKELILDTLKKLNPSTIAINYSKDSEVCDGLTYGMYLTLCDYLSEISFEGRLVSAEKIVSALRQRKTTGEIEAIQSAVRVAEGVFEKAWTFINVGRTETEVADFMKSEVRKAGLELAWDEKTCPSVFSGPETAGAHYRPTERRVEEGHVLNMDFGVKVGGYCSDLQRTCYILRRTENAPPAEVQSGFDVLVESIEEARKTLRPGVKGHEVDAASRDYLVSNGYEEFPHALGHQVGRFPHDGTALLGPSWEKYGKKPFETIEKGMVFTIEPRLSIPTHGIATVEEMVVVTDDSAEYLSRPQRDLILIASSN
jgi:Xaa-Pro aminopeptidase